MWLAVTAAAILVVIVGAIVYAIRADSRQVASVAAAEPARLSEHEGESDTEHERRAA